MNPPYLISPSPQKSKACILPPTPRQRFHHQDTNCFNSRIAGFGCGFKCLQLQQQKSPGWKFSQAKKKKILKGSLRNEPVKVTKKKGTISGAVALIVGTSIGSGILALPKKISPVGILPSSLTMTMCWAFLLIEALFLVEINVDLIRKKGVKVSDDELDVISITTMARETLGEFGGTFATVTYMFLGYTSMIAYCAKSGEILHHITNFPESISDVLFTALFTILISIGGTRATDHVNQWLTVSMIGLLIAIETLAVLFGGWSGFEGGVAVWEKVPATLPVMIFTLAYHDLVPVLCAYLEGDLTRIRASLLLGSMVPLVAYLIWDAITLGLFNQADQVSDPVELLLSVSWEGVPVMIEVFSLLAVGTSLIGTLLSFSEFFKEQLNILSLDSLPAQDKSNSFDPISNWWLQNKTRIAATAMVIAPSLFVSTTVPDAFSAATDIAGGYCMTMLYGVLPPAMAWAMNKKGHHAEQQGISQTGPVIIGVGLVACWVVLEQIFLNFAWMHH